MDWDDLRLFLAICRGGSVREAALRLAISHSTVSRRLQAFEAVMGAQLFLRHAGGLSPTETGSALLVHAERVESDVLALQAGLLQSDGRLAGRLRISAPPPIAHHLLMPILAPFLQRYPDIEAEVIASYDFTDLDRQHADIAIRFQANPDDHLVGRRLPDLAYSIYATPDYVASHRFHGPGADARWIIWSDKDRGSAWFRASPLPDCGFGPVIPDPLAQLSAARAGLGFVYAPCILADADPALIRVPGMGPMADRPGWILTHPDIRSSQRVKLCVRHLAEGFSALRVPMAGRGGAALASPPVS